MKIAVQASGRILVDGHEVDLSELEAALLQAKLDGATVEYSREHPETHGPPEVDAVLKLITANRLRIALPCDREQTAAPAIEFPGMEVFFSKVRKQAAAGKGISLVRQPQQHFILPSPPEGAIKPQMIEAVKSVIPSDEPRNIAAVAAPGALAGNPGKPPLLPEVGRQVPFFGLLIGLAYMGHAVWIFEATPQNMNAGCEEADVLIVDSNAIAALPDGWLEDASRVMRNPNILIYDRSRQRIGAIRTAGEVPGKIEFLS